jgi:hypothetical protein
VETPALFLCRPEAHRIGENRAGAGAFLGKVIGWVIVAVLAFVAGGLTVCLARKPPVDQHPEWSALGALPDWSGVWEVDWANKRGSPRKPPMKLKPEYQARLDAYKKGQEKGENQQTQAANCVPPGLPGIMTQPYPIEFLYQPGKVVMLTEAYMQFRHIFTDGSAHPADPDPAFYGHSTGTWENDTLVIDSVGFNPSTLLAAGVPHSDQLRIVERIRRVSPEWMEIETTLHDPVVLEEPYTSTSSYRHLDDHIREYICLENNRDGADEKGRSSLRLE